ncbi:carbohydrate kinase [Sulfurimonas hongkongensis]|uniref:ADP-dependent (S)-NAD(P)H-hydrate dehydratase n=1 Tax=Sulfurimonas hongkongensis TaxID=1172190 RepID=T0JQS2_9BACT|nr:NAD(P)H-hydrate dehydratase [Sulfurimonas hongkongensis]EQB39162.1 carbohydrate kinase [Sulfurimonas hongkongensis]
MQRVFDEVASLDERCYKKFGLSEDLLMEHAAEGMASYIRENFKRDAKVIIVCGSGNNGADGITLARLLHGDYEACIYYAKRPKSEMAQLQKKRCDAIGVKVIDSLERCEVLVESIVGTGFSGEFSDELKSLISQMNENSAFKIACDVPSIGFYADVTLTMGALKKSMFLDSQKEFVGEIRVLDLGVSRNIYETDPSWHLLDFEDMLLPNREKKNTHKGSFGHLVLACGQKSGASILSAKAALRFGAGLVTLMGYENTQIPHTIMYSHAMPYNATALALGMGLGDEFSDIELSEFLDNFLPLIADADVFHMEIIKEILKRDKIVLTPHAKEFVALLKRVGLADISVDELQSERFFYVELFTKEYPHATLILKGANVIIAKGDEFFINPHGTSALAKGGSGDVLSGLVGALLAQGYTPLEAAKSASLAHTALAQSYKGADFSLTADDLIDAIGKL